MDAVQVCNVNTADNTNAIIFQMRLTLGDILPDNMTGFYWILIGRVQQWGVINIPYTTGGTFEIPLNIEIEQGLFGNIVPIQSGTSPECNNVVTAISSNNMTVVNWQGGTDTDFHWYMFGQC